MDGQVCRQTDTVKTLFAASVRCRWCSPLKISSTFWPRLCWCLMGPFRWTPRIVSPPVHSGYKKKTGWLRWLKTLRRSLTQETLWCVPDHQVWARLGNDPLPPSSGGLSPTGIPETHKNTHRQTHTQLCRNANSLFVPLNFLTNFCPLKWMENLNLSA